MSSKDLASVNQLRAAVRQLQKDGQEQLTLEYESQATFEYFHGQINALQKGYKTLSDVLLEEVDTLRTEFGKRVSFVVTRHAWCPPRYLPFSPCLLPHSPPPPPRHTHTHTHTNHHRHHLIHNSLC